MVTSFALLACLCLYAINGLIVPITKTDGSLDMSSLMSHLALLEHGIETKASAVDMAKVEQAMNTKASTAELTRVQDELLAAQTKITVLETKLNQCSCSSPGTQNSASPSEVTSLQTDVGHLKQEVFQLQSLHNRTSGSSTFTRWGRTSCPADNTLVYKGFTGGTWYKDHGGSSSVVCLPEDPIYAAHTTGHHKDSSHIYGSEYETKYNGNPFESLYQDDIPCVVCESSRSSSVMIPGRNQCYPGWTLEYWGYLMGGHPDYASAEYICVDSQAEAIPGDQANENGQVFSPVESRCGSLPCPHYHDSWELSCVVCSK